MKKIRVSSSSHSASCLCIQFRLLNFGLISVDDYKSADYSQQAISSVDSNKM